MSYNIASWKTIALDNLSIPLDCFSDKDIRWEKPPNVSVSLGEDGGLSGESSDVLNIHVKHIMLYGMSSGNDFNDVLIPALKKSTGKLSAFLIWERGERCTVLDVNNGDVKHEGFDPVKVYQDLRKLRAQVGESGDAR